MIKHFEKVFQTKLVLQGDETRGAPGAFYKPGSVPNPRGISSLVAAVSLPVPPEFHPLGSHLRR